MNEAYPDLPDWITPGAELYALTGSSPTPVRVTRITPKQIVAESTISPNHPMYRFDREPRTGWPMGTDEPSYRLRGTYFGELVEPTHPAVVADRLRRAVDRATTKIEDAQRAYRSPARDDKRPADERALELLDVIENAARMARRTILGVLAQRDDATAGAEAAR